MGLIRFLSALSFIGRFNSKSELFHDILTITLDVQFIELCKGLSTLALTEKEVNYALFKKLENYNKLERAGINEILNIQANIEVVSISKIRQEDMLYNIRIYLRQFWNDSRLG